jgi:hypothetical protein
VQPARVVPAEHLQPVGLLDLGVQVHVAGDLRLRGLDLLLPAGRRAVVDHLAVQVDVDARPPEPDQHRGVDAERPPDADGVHLAVRVRQPRGPLAGEPVGLGQVTVQHRRALRVEPAGQRQVEPVALLVGGQHHPVGAGHQVGEQRPGAAADAGLRRLLEVPHERHVRQPLADRVGVPDGAPVEQRVDDVRPGVARVGDVGDVAEGQRPDGVRAQPLAGPRAEQPVAALLQRQDPLRVEGQLPGEQHPEPVAPAAGRERNRS